MSADFIIDAHGNRIYKQYACRVCARLYLYADSRERHMREKHGTQYQREEAKARAKRMRETAQRERHAAKHRDLQAAVVEHALRWFNKSGPESDLRQSCAALEKFEKGKKP